MKLCQIITLITLFHYLANCLARMWRNLKIKHEKNSCDVQDVPISVTFKLYGYQVIKAWDLLIT